MRGAFQPFGKRRRSAAAALIAAGLWGFFPVSAAEAPAGEELDGRRCVVMTAALGIGAVTAWGVWQWDYFSSPPSASSEGWFGAGTDSGGADKLGHFYTSYVATHAFAFWYESRGFSREEAARDGALTSLAVLGFVELGDSFSEYGFSAEDLTANLFGCAAGWLLYAQPALAAKIDFRWEPGTDPEKADIFTDYENSKYLMALKLGGFEWGQWNLLRYIELHAGYYTRGFDDDDGGRDRFVYAGIGLNLTDLLFRHGYEKTATVLRYVQPPFISAQARHRL